MFQRFLDTSLDGHLVTGGALVVSRPPNWVLPHDLILRVCWGGGTIPCHVVLLASWRYLQKLGKLHLPLFHDTQMPARDSGCLLNGTWGLSDVTGGIAVLWVGGSRLAGDWR